MRRLRLMRQRVLKPSVGVFGGFAAGVVLLAFALLTSQWDAGGKALAYLEQLQGGVAYVDIEQAMRAHSLWPEYEAVEKELADTLSEWESYLKKSLYYTNPDEYLQMMSELESGQLEALRRQVESEIERETEKRQAELAKSEQEIQAAAEARVEKVERATKEAFQAKLDELAKQLEEEMNTEADKVRKKYQEDMLDIQVELALAKLSEEKRRSKIDELARLQAELDEELAQLTTTFNEKLEEQQAELEKQFQSQLRQEIDRISSEARDEAERARRQLSEELSEFIATKQLVLQQMEQERSNLNFSSEELFLAGRKPEEIGIPSDAVRMQNQIVAELEEQRDNLRQAILRDIQAAAVRIAEEHGIETVLSEEEIYLGGVDVTELVVRELQG